MLWKSGPIPNVPVYVVCPRDEEGCSWTLHRNHLHPINSNIGQDEKDTPMAGVENNTTSTPTPPVDSEPANARPSGMVTPSAAGNTSHGSPNQPAPLRCSTWKTWNWLPWRYWTFSLLAATSLSGIWDALVGLCICLHVISYLYTVFWGSTVWIHSTYTIMCLPSTTQFWHWGEFFQCNLYVGSLDGGGVDQWLFVLSAAAPVWDKFQHSIPIETQGVHGNPTQKTGWQT